MNKNLNQLQKERLINIETHICSVSDIDYQRIQPKIEMIERLAEIESSIYAVFDLHKNHYLLQSREQLEIFGLDQKQDQNINFDMHYERIHPNDLAFVLETDNLHYQFLSNLPFNEKKDYKLVYDFRTRNTDGFYIRHLHQSIPLEQDKNGRTWLTLVISHPMSERLPNEKPQRRLINIKTGELHLFNKIDGKASAVILTKREKEVLILISRGYDSYNIADKMRISINTVNNHRQNILRKTRTDNATQAVLYSKRIGII
ncbi:response regulator transcription factor [Roseimarinus sediminis]|jgi:DNA-binding CsgD family transcriptional regulator|uniref:response regulator transcription factor n=1 Tax=Roseimarinus sediminis TaxID=1610899 RepID=UPI003D1B0DED